VQQPLIQRRGLMLILSSPSGAGKTTLSRRLREADSNMRLSISVTTRAPRPGEVHGEHYLFAAREEFAAMRERGEFLEWAEVFGNSYGTPRAPVSAALEGGRDVLFDIDWQGARQIVSQMPADVVSVFILPPSREALRQRLHTRAADTEAVIAVRQAVLTNELLRNGLCCNDDLVPCFQSPAAILAVERQKCGRKWLTFVRMMEKPKVNANVALLLLPAAGEPVTPNLRRAGSLNPEIAQHTLRIAEQRFRLERSICASRRPPPSPPE
jgi:guanylate kinase